MHAGNISWLTKLEGGNAWIVAWHEENPDGATAGRATDAPTDTAASLTRDGTVAGLDASITKLPLAPDAVHRADATEEILVEMDAKELTSLSGWRGFVLALRDWFASHGFDNLARWMNAALEGTLSDQARADLFAADLVRRARAFVENGPPLSGGLAGATALSQLRKLADDLPAQEKWLNTEARMRGFKDIEDLLARDYPLFEKLATLWRKKHPADVMLSIKRHRSGVMTAEADKYIVPEVEPYLSNTGLLDLAYLDGKPVRIQVGRHEGKIGLLHLLGNWAADNRRKWDSLTDDDAENVARGVLNLFGSKETIKGHLVDGRMHLVYKMAGKTVVLAPKGGFWTVITFLPHADSAKFGDSDWRGRLTFPSQATADAASSGSGHPDNQSQRQGLVGQEVVSEQFQYKLGEKKPQPTVTVKKRKLLVRGEDDTKLSRTPDAAQRADAILADSTAKWRPLDAITKAGVKLVHFDRATKAIYAKAGKLLDALTPEKVKAGVVADYGPAPHRGKWDRSTRLPSYSRYAWGGVTTSPPPEWCQSSRRTAFSHSPKPRTAHVGCSQG